MMSLPHFPDQETEAAFWDRHDSEKQVMRRLFMFLSPIFMQSFVILDWFVGADQTTNLIIARSCTSLGMLLGTALFWLARTHAGRERGILTYGLTAVIGEIVFCVIAPAEAVAYYQFGLVVVMCFGAVVVVPRFRTIRRLFLIVILSYAIATPFFDADPITTTVNALFCFMIACAVVIGSFERERLERLQGFAEHKLAIANDDLSKSRLEALHARDAAVEANRAKNQFVASVSHELRTPLNAIIGFSDLIQRELYGPITPDAYAEYICYIHHSGKLLETNIGDLMDLARIESGKLGWVDETFSVAEMLEAAVATCHSNAETADVHLELKGIIPDVQLYADKMRIGQAVINLATNALKFTESGGQVIVSAAWRPNSSIALSIEDTGVGMLPEALERVCKPFAQAHDDSAGKSKAGLGLGLAIVNGILEQIDGKLELTSELGVGTKAVLVIPPDRVLDRCAQVA